MYTKAYHTEDLSKYTFLITGGAGFIGSNLVEYLLKFGAGKVRVLDNFSTGFLNNLKPFMDHPCFELLEGDICEVETCRKALKDIQYVSHQAALGSVPRSIDDPITTNAVNISGFLNMLCAVKESNTVEKFVYAASSSTYGDSTVLPKVEAQIGKPLSPYAVTKYVNELYADVFYKTYGVNSIGLRYFNVFGPKQAAGGAYAAVIPLFIAALIRDEGAFINGDGEQTRDFTFVENAVQANIKSFFIKDENALNQVYNIAFGSQITLNKVWSILNRIAGKQIDPQYKPDRKGDIRNSLADISKAAHYLNYNPIFSVEEGLEFMMHQLKL